MISEAASAWLETLPTNWRDRVDAWAHCPVCRRVVWAGVRHRRDAVYCSARCRTKAWRARAAVGTASEPTLGLGAASGAEDRDRVLFETIYVCGARPAEVCGLDVEDSAPLTGGPSYLG
ncbi:hypothetical protein ACQP1V_22800 [Microtetraspora malaysiensis]|uniref:hypothetical protein n=1 Tax=Microtetraspora malaysiensis TaxID=161358 RepID=UPI003D93A768